MSKQTKQEMKETTTITFIDGVCNHSSDFSRSVGNFHSEGSMMTTTATNKQTAKNSMVEMMKFNYKRLR